MATDKRPVTVVVTRNRKEAEAAQKLLLAADFRWRGGENSADLSTCSAIYVGEAGPADLCYTSGLIDDDYSGRPVRILDAAKLSAELVAKFPGAHHAKITLKWLRERDACDEGLEWFAATFGKSAAVDAKTLRRVLPEDRPSWIAWLDNACKR